MEITDRKCQNVLVAIASFGTANDQYLKRLIHEYRSMAHHVDIVVLSNLYKEVSSDVDLLVGLPTKDPWSLPFGHKKVFANRLEDYDVFIYSEDDVLITQRNLAAFLEACEDLPDDQIAGFLRIEKGRDGQIFYPEVHHRYHWDPRSVRVHGQRAFAYFSNEHAACYIMTRQQLRRAIASGGFLVEPHAGKYDMLCTAATDPYTQCGFRKLLCISHLDDFVVQHLPNKYVGKLGLSQADFELQIEALMKSAEAGAEIGNLFADTPPPVNWLYCRDYYEPARADVLSLLPDRARNVLSIGCGWGAAEQRLVQQGKRVVAVPLDTVISACAKARGVETIASDLARLPERLNGDKFDVVFVSNVLHLIRNPVQLLCSLSQVLSRESMIIAPVPNLESVPVLWRRTLRKPGYIQLKNFDNSGFHLTSTNTVSQWLLRSGLRVDRIIKKVPQRARVVGQLTFGLVDSYLASELIFVASRA
jgi:2-polyprenyl-3-methyl-5-hydroxy-6-metoxy-1,4-benzoquinol methylase